MSATYSFSEMALATESLVLGLSARLDVCRDLAAKGNKWPDYDLKSKADEIAIMKEIARRLRSQASREEAESHNAANR